MPKTFTKKQYRQLIKTMKAIEEIDKCLPGNYFLDGVITLCFENGKFEIAPDDNGEWKASAV